MQKTTFEYVFALISLSWILVLTSVSSHAWERKLLAPKNPAYFRYKVKFDELEKGANRFTIGKLGVPGRVSYMRVCTSEPLDPGEVVAWRLKVGDEETPFVCSQRGSGVHERCTGSASTGCDTWYNSGFPYKDGHVIFQAVVHCPFLET